MKVNSLSTSRVHNGLQYCSVLKRTSEWPVESKEGKTGNVVPECPFHMNLS